MTVVDAPYGTHQLLRFKADGAPVLAAATTGLATPGYTLIVDESAAADLYAVLVNKGCVPCGEEDWERARVTQGRPAPGAELTEVSKGGAWRGGGVFGTRVAGPSVCGAGRLPTHRAALVSAPIQPPPPPGLQPSRGRPLPCGLRQQGLLHRPGDDLQAQQPGRREAAAVGAAAEPARGAGRGDHGGRRRRREGRRADERGQPDGQRPLWARVPALQEQGGADRPQRWVGWLREAMPAARRCSRRAAVYPLDCPPPTPHTYTTGATVEVDGVKARVVAVPYLSRAFAADAAAPAPAAASESAEAEDSSLKERAEQARCVGADGVAGVFGWGAASNVLTEKLSDTITRNQIPNHAGRRRRRRKQQRRRRRRRG